jgi:hypothetical protein
MSKNGIGIEGIFLIGFSVFACIAIGVDWLIEGHVSHEFLWWLLSVYVGLVLARFHERLDTIRDNTDEIKKQNEELRKQNEKMKARFDELEKNMGDVERAIRYMNHP